MTDTERIDALETLLWSDRIGNGLAIFPCFLPPSDVKHLILQDLGDENGLNLGEDLTLGRLTLRAVLDDLITESSD